MAGWNAKGGEFGCNMADIGRHERLRTARRYLGGVPSSDIWASLSMAERGDWKGLADHARSLVQRFPLAGYPRVVVGTVMEQLGDMASALSEYRAAARLVPEFAPCHVLVGRTLRALGDFPGSVDELRVAYNLSSRPSPALLCELGCALEGFGDLEGARAAWRAAVNAEKNWRSGGTGFSAITADGSKQWAARAREMLDAIGG